MEIGLSYRVFNVFSAMESRVRDLEASFRAAEGRIDAVDKKVDDAFKEAANAAGKEDKSK